jgi:hypothetical protein
VGGKVASSGDPSGADRVDLMLGLEWGSPYAFAVIGIENSVLLGR